MAIGRGSGMLSVTIDSKKVEDLMRNLQVEIPKAADRTAKKIASKYAQIYLNQMSTARITQWTGRSFNVLKRQVKNPYHMGRGVYGVLVPSTLVALDQMSPHWVALKRSRAITRWARSKGNLGVRVRAETGGSIFVKPHPWITQANTKARKWIKRIPKKETRRAIRRSKR